MGRITWDGRPFFHKPPLYFWLTVLTYHLTGINIVGARLWAAWYGFGSLALTLVLGARLRSWVVGAGAVLLFLGVDQAYHSQWWNFLSLSRVGMMDVPLTFWIMLAMLCIWEAERRPCLLALIGLPVGLAVLTKAWPGFLPIVLALSHRGLMHKGLKPDLKYWGLAAGLATAVIWPWHLWQYSVHGHLFVRGYVGLNLVERVLQPGERHRGGRGSMSTSYGRVSLSRPMRCRWPVCGALGRSCAGKTVLRLYCSSGWQCPCSSFRFFASPDQIGLVHQHD